MYDNYYKKKREFNANGKLKYFGTKSALLRARVLCNTKDSKNKYLERTYPGLDKSNYLNLISAPNECF